ncbi:uncharacterized protein MKK02DRAFT_39013 [Dioszegia hungarica]|uniref:F-box domain-containing protein n=1 Tax=Dioszegia hungarica TaxID=4972 RepID=A0AA38LUT3_9TREE|nr:uncharacterized protein MKK02DRAFT_39013 [Dioszegia hungarica]KAI9634336.1 hypothetical protein MKK02DRAFT_39013 [Dioszegia hungarica]
MPDPRLSQPQCVTLTDLPYELIAMIAVQVDHYTALSLARVAPQLTLGAQHGIWRSLDLSVSPYYGQRPSYRPRAVPMLTMALHLAEEAKGREDIRRAALKRKAEAMARGVAAGRERMVQRIKVVSGTAGSDGALELLRLTAAYLTALEIIAPFDPEVYSCEDPIQVRMIHHPLAFPSLRHIQLGRGAIKSSVIISLVCGLAPSLESLSVSIDSALARSWEPSTSSSNLTPRINRQLRRLHIESVGASHPNEADQSDAVRSILDLLRHSPSVRQLYTNYAGPRLAVDRLVVAISDLEDLQTLLWDVEADFATYYLAIPPVPAVSTSVSFAKLRRLLLRSSTGDPLKMAHFPNLPVLETLFLVPIRTTEVYLPWLLPYSPREDVQARSHLIPPHIAAGTRSSPQLRYIHTLPDSSLAPDLEEEDVFDRLDGVERKADMNGVISSLWHGSTELVRLRLLRSAHPASAGAGGELPVQKNRDAETAAEAELAETDEGETEMNEEAEEEDEGETEKWRELTNVDDKCISPAALRRMRQAEGASVEEWDKRGVQVSHEAWTSVIRMG